ncbi:cyclic lactone autoinducer peptide [Clostridium niameyense]|nr:cyclic lactone autoinducer peptide [Clostridium niameyense]
MKNLTGKKLSKLSAKVLKGVANSTSASVCAIGAYQPKEPKCLKK